MLQSGRVAFGAIEAVAFGRPAAEAAEAGRCQAERVFLMVSGTLNRETDEVEKLQRALGNPSPGCSTICRRTRHAMPSSKPLRWRARREPI